MRELDSPDEAPERPARADTATESDGADLPEMHDWRFCERMSDAELRTRLIENFDPREYDPRILRSIDYSPMAPEGADGRDLGFTAPDDDGVWDAPEGLRIKIYDHDGVTGLGPEADQTELRETLYHEMAHITWARASPELRDAYAREVFQWSLAHRQAPAGPLPELGDEVGEGYAVPVSDYSLKNAEEHFCEAMSKSIEDPERLAVLDAFTPSGRTRAEWVARLREDGVRPPETRDSSHA